MSSRSLQLWILAVLAMIASDGARVLAQTAPAVELILVDGLMSESWPDPGVVAVRRAGLVGDLTVQVTITGTAVRGVDYSAPAENSITIPDGRREAWMSFTPLPDARVESTETITVRLARDRGYTAVGKGETTGVSLTLADAGSKPGPKEAIRFLTQAAFGPSADSVADTNLIPENAESVMAKGFEGWIEGQFRTVPGRHQPVLDALVRAQVPISGESKIRAWWSRAIGSTAMDPLRQRVAFALSEIFVISDRLDVLSIQPRGMLNYYDMLVKGAFGNYRALLKGVALHPCMGAYLSHLKNRKADPALGTFPDENFAREIMQLFSIGLWRLNPDGTPQRDDQGRTIPTYDNAAITNMARVFTGLSFGGPRGNNFWWPPEDWLNPMRLWDEYHDMAPKTLLNGVVLPARTASNPDVGTAGMLDIEGAIDCLFHHPNTGPFIGRQLIQRLVTSNPSPAYVGRVSAAFANNGAGVRGDMKAVIKAVLLDPEARDPGQLASLTFGKMKEPYLRTAGLARAFNARSAAGHYVLSYLDEVHAQQPYSSPSVFNFFRPGFVPAGPISDADLVAPEFQILNAITSIALPNYYFDAVRHGFNRWGHENPRYVVRPNLTAESALAKDVPALMRRLDLVLTGGRLEPEQHQIIREAVEAINETFWDWQFERVCTAIYLIATLPDHAIQR